MKPSKRQRLLDGRSSPQSISPQQAAAESSCAPASSVSEYSNNNQALILFATTSADAYTSDKTWAFSRMILQGEYDLEALTKGIAPYLFNQLLMRFPVETRVAFVLKNRACDLRFLNNETLLDALKNKQLQDELPKDEEGAGYFINLMIYRGSDACQAAIEGLSAEAWSRVYALTVAKTEVTDDRFLILFFERLLIVSSSHFPEQFVHSANRLIEDDKGAQTFFRLLPQLDTKGLRLMTEKPGEEDTDRLTSLYWTLSTTMKAEAAIPRLIKISSAWPGRFAQIAIQLIKDDENARSFLHVLPYLDIEGLRSMTEKLGEEEQDRLISLYWTVSRDMNDIESRNIAFKISNVWLDRFVQSVRQLIEDDERAMAFLRVLSLWSTEGLGLIREKLSEEERDRLISLYWATFRARLDFFADALLIKLSTMWPGRFVQAIDQHIQDDDVARRFLRLLCEFNRSNFNAICQHVSQAACDKLLLIIKQDNIAVTDRNQEHIWAIWEQSSLPLRQEILWKNPFLGPRLLEVLPQKWTAEQIAASLADLIEHPDGICSKGHLKGIVFQDNGVSVDFWSSLTQRMVTAMPSAKRRPDRLDLSLTFAQDSDLTLAVQANYLDALNQQGWQFSSLLGRTIFLQKDGQELAVKISKAGEEDSLLVKEQRVCGHLQANAAELGLQSSFPQPQGVLKTTEVFAWLHRQQSLDAEALASFTTLVGCADDQVTAYSYLLDSKNKYRIYLHDPELSTEEFNRLSNLVLDDLVSLLGRGLVFDQLADIFHNTEQRQHEREDVGRYRTLVNLLSGLGLGTGRLTAWLKAVLYPNLRASGLADLADHRSINDYLEYSPFMAKYFRDVWVCYGDKSGNRLLLNILAEYLYVLQLIAGKRAVELTNRAKAAGQSEQEIDQIWQAVAAQQIRNAALLISRTTFYNQKQADILLRQWIGVDALARQMRYWMTTDYVADLDNNRIRPGIYDEGCEISVNKNGFRPGTFSLKSGCSINGGEDLDLGLVNGQEPIKKGDELRHVTMNIIVTAFLQFTKTLNDLRSPTSREANRHRLFSHLSQKQQARMQMALCKNHVERPGVHKQIQEEFRQELENRAASAIFGFWRSSKTERANRAAQAAASSSSAPGTSCQGVGKEGEREALIFSFSEH